MTTRGMQLLLLGAIILVGGISCFRMTTSTVEPESDVHVTKSAGKPEPDRVGADDNTKISLETPPKWVRGFPILLKVTAFGKQIVPRMDVFAKAAEVTVILETKAGERRNQYEIVSYNPAENDIIATPEGVRGPPDWNRHRMKVYQGQEVAQLMDLSSLCERRTRIPLKDVPTAIYSLHVDIGGGVKSNAIDVEIVLPSETERKFLSDLAERSGYRRRWNRILWEKDDFTELKWTTLGDAANIQIAFHAILVKALSKKNSLDKKLIEEIEEISVPKYLQPEKEFLLWEIAKLSKTLSVPPEKEKELINKYLGLKWRFEDFKRSGKHFLRFRD